MHTASTPNPNADWRTLYRMAIQETNSSLILQRVSIAETAALKRQRELFYLGGTGEEKELLEDALYALRALRTAVQNAQVGDFVPISPGLARQTDGNAPMSNKTKIEYVTAALISDDGKRKYETKLELTIKEVYEKASLFAREIEHYKVVDGFVVEDGIYTLRYTFDGQQQEHRKLIHGSVMRAA